MACSLSQCAYFSLILLTKGSASRRVLQDTVLAPSPGVTGPGDDLTGYTICPAWPESASGGPRGHHVSSDAKWGGALGPEKLLSLKRQTGYRKVWLKKMGDKVVVIMATADTSVTLTGRSAMVLST